ncbi:glycosyltransferase [Nocardioides mangrovi]|uniref:Glycosyltransferase n=1 Tax=Nocardioides mangrovi TaxID=2874580 RepID=A0ABS7UBX1_9ACTN|nr:glycosyltransferase [Nocardioides mangrovi]MBZ5738499.1 glycosyltransferase [Nocardioides mangrovi]
MTSVVHLAEPSNGGVPAVMAAIAIAQHQAGMQVTVVGHPSSDQRARVIESGVDYVDLPFTDLRLAGKHARLIRDRSRNADLMHFHSSRAGLFRAALFLGRRKAVVEFSPHGWGWLAAPRLVRWPYKRVERLLKRVTDHFHLLGHNEVEEARRNIGLKATEYTVIGNGVDTDAFSPGEGKRAGGDDGLEILCVGRLCRQKGQDLLIRAIAELGPVLQHRIRLTLIGAGPDEQELRALASEFDINVGFLGHRTNLVEDYRRADIIVLPSRWEGVPLVAMEAISCGAAVLLTEPASDPGLRPFVRTCQPTASDISTVLGELIRDPIARKELRGRALSARAEMDQRAALQGHVRLTNVLVWGAAS